jgi:hypothetical protein
MACIIHKSNKNAKQRDFRTHVDRNIKKTPWYRSPESSIQIKVGEFKGNKEVNVVGTSHRI